MPLLAKIWKKICYIFNSTCKISYTYNIKMNKWQDSACGYQSEYKEPLDLPLETKQQDHLFFTTPAPS